MFSSAAGANSAPHWKSAAPSGTSTMISLDPMPWNDGTM